MSHLVLGGRETGQNEDYQMSTILRNGTIAPKNSQYPSVQENTDPQSDAIINLIIPTTGTQVHRPMLSPQVQWASCHPGQQGWDHYREPRGRGLEGKASSHIDLGFFDLWLFSLRVPGIEPRALCIIYHIISNWATPQSQGFILTLNLTEYEFLASNIKSTRN